MRYKLLCPLLFIAAISLSQTFDIEQLAPLLIRTSNNAVAEGIINGNPYVYSFGGIDERLTYQGIHLRSFRLDVTQNTWEEIAPLPDPLGGKVASSASRVGDIIYIIGGYHVAANGSETSSAKVHRYDVINNTYLTDGADIPIPIDDQVQVVNDDLIYVITGWSNTGNRTEVQVYNTVTDTWSMATSLPNGSNYKCFGSSGVILDNTIYFYGGAEGPGFPSKRAIRKGVISPGNPLDISWSLITPPSNETRYRNAAASAFGRIFWAGGSETSYNFNGIAYNGSGGVDPAASIEVLSDFSGNGDLFSVSEDVPMDLRSMGEIAQGTYVIVGGMKTGQEVTDETLLLVMTVNPESTTDLSKFDFEISPNPCYEKLTIIPAEWPREGVVKIMNITGQIISSIPLTPNTSSLNVSELNPGSYILQLGQNKKVFVKI